jgi:hypothetical protein
VGETHECGPYLRPVHAAELGSAQPATFGVDQRCERSYGLLPSKLATLPLDSPLGGRGGAVSGSLLCPVSLAFRPTAMHRVQAAGLRYLELPAAVQARQPLCLLAHCGARRRARKAPSATAAALATQAAASNQPNALTSSSDTAASVKSWPRAEAAVSPARAVSRDV